MLERTPLSTKGHRLSGNGWIFQQDNAAILNLGENVAVRLRWQEFRRVDTFFAVRLLERGEILDQLVGMRFPEDIQTDTA